MDEELLEATNRLFRERSPDSADFLLPTDKLANGIRYLVRYGDLDAADSPERVLAAVERFQEDTNLLHVDGVLGERTLRFQQTRVRCPSPLVTRQFGQWRNGDDVVDEIRAIAVEERRVLFWIEELPPVTNAVSLFNRAMDSWLEFEDFPIELKFAPSRGEAHVVVKYGFFNNGLRDADEIPPAALAVAHLGPPQIRSFQLGLWFDSAETFIDNNSTQQGARLQAVAAHEIGHVLGLDHSESDTDLMYKYYQPGVLRPQFNDVETAKNKWGF